MTNTSWVYIKVPPQDEPMVSKYVQHCCGKPLNFWRVQEVEGPRHESFYACCEVCKTGYTRRPLVS